MNIRICIIVLCGLMPALLNAQEESTPTQEQNEQRNVPEWVNTILERVQIHGYAQGGYNFKSAEGSVTNSFVLKRTIFWVDANITDRWTFRFMHNFSSTVQEYYTEFRVTNNNLFNIRIGQGKTGLSYENPLSPSAVETIDVNSEGVAYLAGCSSDPLNGPQGGRDLGLFLFGETPNKFFRYEVDVVNGTGINVWDNDNFKNIIGRLEFRPVKGLNICVTGQYGRGKALVDRPLFNPAIALDEIYSRHRITAGLAYSSDMVNFHGEYLQGLDGEVTSRGGYLTGSVAIIPKTLDFVASADYFNFNTSMREADMFKAVGGLQYWFYKKCRLQLQYVFKNANTDYKSFFTRTPVHMIMCQVQVRFN
ncbi:MAG: porin [Bacteroidales bacterium]|nr:porin [Bacteroidales bacterium]